MFAKRLIPACLGLLIASAVLPAAVSAQPPPYLTQWGTYGAGDGQFDGPGGMAVDASGNVYVADYGNHRVQKFTSTGAYVAQWGTHGSGNGQFNGPEGVAVDAGGNVYVADFGNNRIQKFTGTGSTSPSGARSAQGPDSSTVPSAWPWTPAATSTWRTT